MKNLVIVVLFTVFRLTGFTQGFGFQTGLMLNLGTHVNMMGWTFNAYYTKDFYQFNFDICRRMNFTSYGGRKYFFETRFAPGVVLMTGKQDQIPDFQLDGLLHNTAHRYSLGFNYLFYWDDAGTTQLSGGWSLGLKKVNILFENDVFGGQAKDRFRSGIIEVSYRENQVKYFANLYIWTGETRHSVWNKAPYAGAPNGYRSLETLPYGKTSHGILSVGVRSVLLPGYELPRVSKFYTVKAGIDSEQIRHFFQNKFSHDLIFMPKSYKRTTPHYPRLGPDGKPVFGKKERKKDRFYFQASLNEVWSN
ncbi:MAG: polymorphic toxin type 23 domain-containing protein [Bacteroidota bacterium]